MKTQRQKRRFQIIWTIVTLIATVAMVLFLLIPLIR